MPLYSYECRDCGTRTLDLYPMAHTAPIHCEQSMRRLMPRRVAGWITDSTNERPLRYLEGAENIREFYGTPESAEPIKADPNDPLAFPLQTNWTKDYEDCSASERDERWADTFQACTAWHTRLLEADGVSPREAEQRAKEHQTKVITESRESNSRADGLT